MRVGVVAEERVAARDDLGRDVAVQVERDDDRHGGADGLARAREQVALAVGDPLDDHRAVQGQQDRVDPPRRAQPVEQLPLQRGVGLPGDQA